MRRVAFTVHGKPQPWRRARTGQGRFFKDRATESYQGEIKHACAMAMLAADDGLGEALLTGPLELVVTAIFPKPTSLSRKRAALLRWHAKTPDYDNVAKGVSDALNGLAYADDRQIARALVNKRYSDDGSARLEIEITQLEEDQTMPTPIKKGGR
jgi:Holliday junction resolvase RusA-like endonuclease